MKRRWQHARSSAAATASICRALILFAIALTAATDAASADDREKLSFDWKRLSEASRNPSIPAGDEDAHVVIVRDSVHIDDGGWEPKKQGVKRKTFRNSVPDKYTYVFRHRLLLVRDDAGVDEIGIMELPFEDYSEFIAVRGRVVKPDGSERFLQDDEFHKRTAVSTNRLHVERLVVVVPDLEPGDLVDLVYKSRTEFDYSPPLIRMYDRYPICSMKITWKCRELIESAGQHWAFPHVLQRADHDIAMTPARTIDGEDRVDVTMRNARAVRQEPDMIPADLAHPIFVPTYRWPAREKEIPYWSWAQDLGVEDREAFIEDADALDGWLRRIAAESRNRTEDLEYCLDTLHKRLHPKTRKETANDRPPRNTCLRDVLENGAALDREKNWVLVAMLRRLGYDATTAWCGFDRRGRIAEEWRSLRQFDTEIVAVPRLDGTDFLFPAFRGSTPASLPYQLMGGQALIMKAHPDDEPQKDAFTSFGHNTASDNRVFVQARLDASVEPPRAYLEVNWECPAEVTLRNRLDQAETGESAAALREEMSLDAESVEDERVRLRVDSFSYECSLTVANMVENLGEYSQIDLSVFVPDRRDYPAGHRRSPIDLKYPRTVQADIEVVLPVGASVESFDAMENGRAKFGQFSVTTTETGDRLRRRSELVLDNSWLRPEDYSGVAAFFTAYSKAAGAKVTVSTGPVQP